MDFDLLCSFSSWCPWAAWMREEMVFQDFKTGQVRSDSEIRLFQKFNDSKTQTRCSDPDSPKSKVGYSQGFQWAGPVLEEDHIL